MIPFGKILKWLAYLSLGLLILSMGLMWVAWQWPGLWINQTHLETLRRLSFSYVRLSWRMLEVNARSESFLVKRITVRAEDICYENNAREFLVCFRELSTNLTFSFGLRKPTLHIGHTKLLGGKVAYHENENPERAAIEKSLDRNSRAAISWLGFLKKGDLSSLSLEVDSVKAFGKGIDLQAEVRLHAVKKDQKVQYRFLGRGQESKKKLSVEWKGDWSGSEVVGRLTAVGERFHEGLPRWRVLSCPVTISEKHFQVSCPTQVSLLLKRKDAKKQTYLGSLEIQGVMKPLGERGAVRKKLLGKLQWEVFPVLHRFQEGRLKLVSHFEAQLNPVPEAFQFDAGLEGEIQDFRRISWALRKSRWGIPEPLNSLRGSVRAEAHVKGHGNFKADGAGEKWDLQSGGKIPLTWETRLSSLHQKLEISGDGEWSFRNDPRKFSHHLEMKVILSEVRLVMPRLDLQVPPRMAPDWRIQLTPEVERELAAESNFTYRIEIETPKERPLRLVSNLASDDIPVTLSLALQSGRSARGILRLGQFPVEFFRRKALVERFEMTLADNPENREVKGRLRVAHPDYTIRILILGTSAEPKIQFVSEPPLPEDQVIAVLLFGRPLKDLNAAETGSVGSARAALAQGAMSLASMYLLASTPVENISYDQATGVFAARIRLGDGTSLSLGSDTKQLNQLGVQQRLGPDLTVTTYLANPFDPIERSLSAFLEWSRGY